MSRLSLNIATHFRGTGMPRVWPSQPQSPSNCSAPTGRAGPRFAMNKKFGMQIPMLQLVIGLLWAGTLAAAGDVATNYAWVNFAGQPGFDNSGSLDGTGSAAQFYYPSGVALDTNGNVYVADQANHTIRQITPAGAVTTIAGSAGSHGNDDGTNSAARFWVPSDVAVDSSGNLFVADTWNNSIREVSPVGSNWVVTTIVDGSSGLNGPSAVTVDASGNLFVADTGNNRIREVTLVGPDWVMTTIVGSTAGLSGPQGITVDASGNLFVADTGNNGIQKVTLVGSDWVMTNIVDGTAGLNNPQGLVVDPSGNLFVADTWNNSIQLVTPVGTNWVVTTIGGSGSSTDYGIVDGTNTLARFRRPSDIAMDGAGNLYVADTLNNRISKGSPFNLILTITTASPLPSGNVGTAYSTTLAAVYGATPYSWAVLSGGLPDGLTLSTNTGVISGTPTTNGTSSFSIRVTDTNSITADQAFSLTINPPLTAYQIWQLLYFGCTNCSQAAPDADPLGKGMSNTNQFLAGLNPTNAASVFRIISTVVTGADFVLTWKAVGGKSYVVQTNAVPGSGYADGSPLISVPGSSETVTNWTDTGGATNRPARFYRVRLGP